MKEWSPEDDKRIRALWDKGKTMSFIAAEFNTTRSAIAGKARRLNLPSRGGLPDDEEVRRAKRAKRNAESQRKARLKKAKEKAKSKPIVEKAEKPKSEVTLLFERGTEAIVPNAATVRYDEAAIPREPIAGASCLYIYGDDYVARIWAGEPIFCGEPTIKGVRYCAAHALKCYTKVTRRRGDPNLKSARWTWNK